MTDEERATLVAATRAQAFREAADYCNKVSDRCRRPHLVRADGVDTGDWMSLGADRCAVALRCWVDAEERKAGLR